MPGRWDQSTEPARATVFVGVPPLHGCPRSRATAGQGHGSRPACSTRHERQRKQRPSISDGVLILRHPLTNDRGRSTRQALPGHDLLHRLDVAVVRQRPNQQPVRKQPGGGWLAPPSDGPGGHWFARLPSLRKHGREDVLVAEAALVPAPPPDGDTLDHIRPWSGVDEVKSRGKPGGRCLRYKQYCA